MLLEMMTGSDYLDIHTQMKLCQWIIYTRLLDATSTFGFSSCWSTLYRGGGNKGKISLFFFSVTGWHTFSLRIYYVYVRAMFQQNASLGYTDGGAV